MNVTKNQAKCSDILETKALLKRAHKILHLFSLNNFQVCVISIGYFSLMDARRDSAVPVIF